ncbi:MAG TPA: hypothetical protein VFV68_10135 [Agriterribacter sp.]|nr:hypothetical protein [Agriterribacter sp.]
MKLGKLLLLMNCLFVGAGVNAQVKPVRDTAYLKNNVVLYGKIILQDEKEITFLTEQGNMYVLSRAEVSKLIGEVYVPPVRGFGHYTEIGALAATKNRPDNVTTAAFSFQTVNGYSFNAHLFTGVGVAADLYATQTTIPVFASIRGNLAKSGRFIPFYFVDGGYGIDITSSTTSISYEGGIMGAAGLGFKIPLSNGAGFLVSFGYRMQKGATTESGVKNNYTNNRIALRAGFYL